MKTTYELSNEELKTILKAWMVTVHMPISDSDVFSIEQDGMKITVEIPLPGVDPAPVFPVSPPVIPVVIPVTPVQKPRGFSPDGPDALIRGDFTISTKQMESLCVGDVAPYSLYAEAIVENSKKYGINPLFVLANLVNQSVNPAYRNPWGISTDHYPYGPNGSQLGVPNGHVPNGPRKFSESEWRTAFDRQFSVVSSGHAYSSASTIAAWALIDAPPGAGNDVHGTNAQEGSDVGSLYNRLVSQLS